MDTQAIMQADYLDLVFDHRNKLYGGYELRKHYGNRLGKAVAILFAMLTALMLVLFLYRPVADVRAATGRHAVTEISEVILPAQKIIPPKVLPPQPPLAKIKTERFTDPVITNDPIPDDKHLPNTGTIQNVGIGNDGDSTGTDIIPDKEPTGKGNIFPPDTRPEEPRRYVEQMPAFDGDINAYLSSHVHYPALAREAGIEGKVQIEFVVNEDGTVANARVLRSIGGGCNEEALRVISAMPKWKPGKQNGHPVKVYFSVAVNFVLE